MTHTPQFLKSGDKIGIVAPASVIRYEDILPGIDVIRNEWQLEIVEGKTLRSGFNQFAATDDDRRDDIQTMLDNPDIKMIIAARGGYGCSRIIDQLDFTKFKKNPKWIVGFSDLTVFVSALYNLGFASVHAPMVKSMMLEGAEQARQYLRELLFGKLPAYQTQTHIFNRSGKATGEIVGGNLCLFAHMIGSPTDIDTTGKILFLEDVGEYMYNLDRMMLQLKRAGKLSQLAGLVVGQFSDMKDNADPTFGKSTNEIIREHVGEYNYPACYNFPVGHVADNRPIPVGMNAQLNVSADSVSLNFLQPPTIS